jgi:hypothetical protein
MDKARDWGDVGAEGGPGAIRRKGDDPATDIPLDDVPPRPNGHAMAIQIDGAINRARPAPHVRPGGTTVIQDADTLEMEIIDWLWLHWLALGKLHLIAGAPEAGKTTIALALAATISSGSYWPDGTKAPTGNVLIWTSEDSLADTIKPRLVRMGAGLTRIKFIIAQRAADGKTRPFNPATDMPSLIEAAKTIEGGVQLLIIDPIVAAIGTKTNSHNNAETRNSLQSVVDSAESSNCAVLGISHFTKGTGGKDPIERVTGSLAFGALPVSSSRQPRIAPERRQGFSCERSRISGQAAADSGSISTRRR